MQKYLFILLGLMLSLLPASAESVGWMPVGLDRLIDSPIPCIVVDTKERTEPSCDFLEPPEGSFGMGVTNAAKIPGRIRVFCRGEQLYDSHAYATPQDSGMTIKIRGNASAYWWTKKSFKVHLAEKADLLCRADEQPHADKDWLLLPAMAKTMVGLYVNEQIGMAYTPAYALVNLIVNDDYRGVYSLMESVKRNTSGRIDISKQHGYLIEFDLYYWNEPLSFSTPGCHPIHGYTFKYPDPDDILPSYVDDVKADMLCMESSIDDGSYETVIDVPAFAAWLLAHDLLGTRDDAGSNIYLTRYDMRDASSLITMPCLWDFDSILDNPNAWANIHLGRYFFFGRLLRSSNPAFLRAYKALWDEKGEALCDKVVQWLEDIKQDEAFMTELEYFISLDSKRWNYQDEGFAGDLTDLQTWFTHRKTWMRQAVAGMTEARGEDDGIQPVRDVRPSDTFYDMQGKNCGTRPSSLAPGCYVLRGRKVVVR